MRQPRPNTRNLVLAAALGAGTITMWTLSQTDRAEERPLEVLHADAEAADGQLAASFSILDDGSRLDLDVAAPSAVGPGDYELSATLGLQAAIPDSEALAFAFDMSFSTYLFGGQATGCGGDFNSSDGPNDIIDCELASILSTIEHVDTFGAVAEVGLVPFFAGAGIADVQPVSSHQSFTTPSADLDGDGIRDLETVLRSAIPGRWPRSPSCVNEFDPICAHYGRSGGITDYSGGLDAACTLLGTSSQPVKTLIFLSDGEATRASIPLTDVLPCPGVTVHTVALGSSSSCDEDPRGVGSLQDVADLGGGTCVAVTEPDQLASVLVETLVARVTHVTLSVDGGPEVDVSASVVEGLPHLGSGSLHLAHSVTGLDEGAHEFCFTAHASGSVSGVSGSVTECVDTTIPNEAPVADAGADLTVIEGDAIALDGTQSADPDGDPLSYRWELVGTTGPALLVPSAVLPTTTVQSLDDGIYTFQLTVSDGELESTDAITVTVANADPVLAAEADDATAEGVSLLTASFTDMGVLDTHTASVDWGDGSANETIEVSAQGTGWGSLFASHVYGAAGSYPVTVTLTDDDGGTVVAETSLTIGEAVAVWGDAATDTPVDFTGGDGLVAGLVHSNAAMRFGGAHKTIQGEIEYVTEIKANGGVDLDANPVQVAPAVRPVVYDIADYRPGGASAVRAGADFHDVSAQCVDGVWDPDGPLAAGLYYTSCSMKLNAAALTGTITVAAEGTIQVSGSDAVFSPYVDGLLFLSNNTSTQSIKVSGSGETFLGFLYSAGGIDLSGSGTRYMCGIVGEQIDLSASGLQILAADCVRPGRTSAPPLLVPDLSLTLANAVSDALAGEPAPSEAVVSNDGALLLVPGIVGLEHLGTASVTVADASVVLEALDVTTGLWTEVPGTTTLVARPNSDPGTIYPATPEPFVGTELQPDALATWGVQLQVELTPGTVGWLVDPAQVSSVRMEVVFTLDDPSQPVRQLYRFGDDLAQSLRDQGGAITDIEVTLAAVDGATSLRNGSTDPALLELAAGDRVALTALADAPTPGPRTATETNEAYLSRLASFDGAQLGAVAFARGTGGVGTVLAPQVLDTTTLHVPVVDPEVTAPTALTSADLLTVGIEVFNDSTVDALSMAVDTTHDDQGTVAIGLPANLVSGQVAGASVVFDVAEGSAGTTVGTRTVVDWSDAAGNAYGPLTYDTETFIDLPATLQVSLADTRAVDADRDGLTSAGDTLGYSVSVANQGSVALSDVVLTIPLDPGLSLVPGSVSASTGTVLQADDSAVVLEIGTLAGFSNAMLGFEAVTDPDLIDNVDVVSVQGTVTTATLAAVGSDDPATAATGDPTVTELLEASAELTAALDDIVSVDADLNNAVTAGDTLHYIAFVGNSGGAAANGAQLDVVPAPGSILLEGSVTTTAGTVTLGNGTGDGSILVDLGHLPSLSGHVVEWDVIVQASTGTLSVQGELAATDASDTLTDDPMTTALLDPTITQLGVTGVAGGGTDDGGGTGETVGPAPSVVVLSPPPGDRVGAPTDVVVEATPLDGETLTGWRVVLYPSDGLASQGTELASGSGDPTGTVLGVFDPTLLENGGWTIRVEATDTSGATGTGESAVVVDGQAKLGSYDLAFMDAEWTTPISTTSLLRSYRSIRKDAVGDFGHGWRLSMTDVTVQTNGPLGDDGWSQVQCGGGAIFVPLCFESSKPHLVVVKWPTGRVDAFDFTPGEASTFFPQVSTAGYTARPGTFSTLTPAASDGTLTTLNDGNLYRDLSFNAVYDPQRFWLTDPDGTRYLLDKATGLAEVVDRLGNRTVFTDGGIFPDVGAPVVFVRDAQDRIEQMQLPDGSAIDYVYDGAGDLVEVIDGDGGVTELAYDGSHRLTSYGIQGHAEPIVTVTYDADGRVDSVTGDGGVFTTESTDLTGFNQTTVGPDPRLTTTRTYGPDGLMTEMVSSYVDGNGVQQELVESWTYGSDYLAQDHTLATGAVESWTYDGSGRVASHTDAAGVVREWTYGPFGLVAEVREGGQVAESTTFDANDLPFEVRRGDGTLVRRMSYDSLGLPLTFENGTGQVLTLTYDANSQIDSLTLPDFAGNPDVVDVVMDGRGQLLEVTRNYPDGPGTTEYTYDANGNQTGIIDPRGHVMSFTFDDLGRQLSYTDKLGKTKSWAYDEAGRETSMTNRNGEVLARTYDAAGRLATLTGPGVDKQFTYDPLGRIVAQRNGTHIETRTYDGPFLVEVTVDGVVDHTWDLIYDGAGRLEQLDGESQSVSYGYDSRGRLSTVSEALIGTFSYGYDAASRVSSLTRPSGAVTTMTYNAAGQTTGIVTHDGLGALVHQVLTTWDSRALPETQTDPEGTLVYDHDAAGRLTGVDHPAGAFFADEAYTYDQASRRTSSHVDPLAEVVYDGGDRLLQDAQYTYAYDDEGRRLSREDRFTGAVTTYRYSALDQMVGLTDAGVTWEFAFDARDLRVLVANDAGYGEAFVYDESGLVRASYDAATGQRTAGYVTGFGFGEVLARVDGAGDVTEALRDRLGSTVGWLDGQTGQVFEQVIRDAYGVRSGLPSVVVPYGFTGHAEDPTGLVWGRARCYSPTTGTWTGEDPVSIEGRYSYVRGRPGLSTDPTGTTELTVEAWFDCVMGKVAVLEGTGVAMIWAAGWSVAGAALDMAVGTPGFIGFAFSVGSAAIQEAVFQKAIDIACKKPSLPAKHR